MTEIQAPKGNPLVKRSCLRITGRLASPLLVGSGEDDVTDMDVILDAKGEPFVPGSALAGAFGHYLADLDALGHGDGAWEEWFGWHNKQSRLWVYDMVLPKAQLGRRDGVKLDVFKTAEDMGKYEMQVVEPGAAYVMRLELVVRIRDEMTGEDGLEQMRKIVDGLAKGEITLGAKSRRGFGKLKVEEALVKHFDFTVAQDCKAWLDWDWNQEHAFDRADSLYAQANPSAIMREHCLQVPLKIRQSLMIRQYAQQRFQAPNWPDYEQLQSGGSPVIPGTTWMGALRGRLGTILTELEPGLSTLKAQKRLEPLLGTWAAGKLDPKPLRASAVKVEESPVQGGSSLLLTRNAIDRFTGGTASGALYTTIPWVGGNTELVLRWPWHLPDFSAEAVCGLLLWVIYDLQNGLLAVGGETAVGRGTFEDNGAVELDGQPLQNPQQYMQAALDWCQQQREKEACGE